MSLRRALLVLACAASGCASTSASKAPAAPATTAASASPEASAPDLKALFAREREPLKKVALAPPQGRFTGQVEASGTPTYEEGEGLTQLVVPLGTTQDMQCFVYAERINAGAALSNILEHVRKGLQVRAVRPTAVVVVKEAPAVLAEVVYTSERNGQQAIGQLKLMVHADNSTPVLCMHDEAGYVQTFQRVATGLAASLATTGEGYPTPRYSEVHVLRVGEQPVGFDWRAVYEGKEKGMRLDENISALLLPQAADQLMTTDNTVFAITDARGQVVEMAHEEVNNGEPELHVALQREKKGRRYSYEGTHSGKPLKGTFEAPKGLTTEMAMVQAVRERLLAGKSRELRFAIYSPDANPAAPLEVVYRRDAGKPRSVTMQLGGIQVSAVVDPQGLFERYSMPMGSVNLESERAFVRGTP